MKKKIKAIIRLLIRLFLRKSAIAFLSEKLLQVAYLLRSESWFSLDIPEYKHRFQLYSVIADNEKLKEDKITYLEFGVSRGDSFRKWLSLCKNPGSNFVGFDTFEGLPESWGSVEAGTYSAEGKVPETGDHRARFSVGLIQDTLEVFIEDNNDHLSNKLVIQLDVDLYNATLFSLLKLMPYLKAGDILLFDEFFSFTKSDHEFRAFEDFLLLNRNAFLFEPVGKTRHGQFAIKLC